VLLVFLWTVMPTREREDQWIFALQLAELPQGASMIKQFVVRGSISWQNVRTHDFNSSEGNPWCAFQSCVPSPQ
jgi:hypothetical protein